MKNSIKTLALISISILFSSFTYATSLKTLAPIEKHNIEFDLSQFYNYINHGNAHPLEGVYASPDRRYQIAIVKNDESHHDFIGIVINADNKYWKAGDVKFNFILKGSSLMGYYYNSKGAEHPIQFNIDGDTLGTACLIKMIDPLNSVVNKGDKTDHCLSFEN